MILEIKLSNFYSIKDEVVLDLRAANLKTAKSKALSRNFFSVGKENVLKSVAIYGANASGKTNIIKAIRFCCSMVLHSHTHNENTVFNFKPFKFRDEISPSEFSIRFISKGIEYLYSFTLTEHEIINESLYFYPNGRKAKIFERDETNGVEKREKYSFGTSIKKPLDVATNTSDKTLFISRASQLDREIGKEIYNYFNSKFILRYLGVTPQYQEKFFNENKNFVLKALQIADSDIVDISYEKQKFNTKSFSISGTEGTPVSVIDSETEEMIFKTYHKSNPSIPFDLKTEESKGTIKLFNTLLEFISVIQNEGILLIDEIDESLHSNIVEFIIELFHKSKNSQLIFSTHNTNLINLNKMRKDQIYFVNKDEKGTTDLYSLYDFKDFRENMDAEKGYLQGRFDAVPLIDSPDDLIF